MSITEAHFDALLQIVDETAPEQLPARIAALPGGIDGALEDMFALLVSEFNPRKAGRRRGLFRFELTGRDRPGLEGARWYFVRVLNGICTAGAGSPADADVTIRIGVADMLLMGLGRLPGLQAFSEGRLELEGDPVFAALLGEWFDHPPVG